MECELIETELMPFYFGSISLEKRTRCEAHLLACRKCLHEFLEIKNHVEVEPQGLEIPSPELPEAIKAKLGEEVIGKRREVLRFSKRRVFQGVAMAASLVIVLLGVLQFRNEARKVSPLDLNHAEVDTSRENAVSLNLL